MVPVVAEPPVGAVAGWLELLAKLVASDEEIIGQVISARTALFDSTLAFLSVIKSFVFCVICSSIGDDLALDLVGRNFSPICRLDAARFVFVFLKSDTNSVSQDWLPSARLPALVVEFLPLFAIARGCRWGFRLDLSHNCALSTAELDNKFASLSTRLFSIMKSSESHLVRA